MKRGDVCYIILNNSTIEEVVIKSISGNLYTVKFIRSDKAIRLPKHRLFETEEEAMPTLPIKKTIENKVRSNRHPTIH